MASFLRYLKRPGSLKRQLYVMRRSQDSKVVVTPSANFPFVFGGLEYVH
jgi:hypothetical protein